MRRTLLPLALAALLAGCGESAEGLLSERNSAALIAAVDEVEKEVAADDCEAAEVAASEGRETALELPGRVDDDLRQNLVDWFAHLEQRVRRDCEAEPDEEPTSEPTEEPTQEPTSEPTEEPTQEPTATPTATPTTDPTPEPPPDQTGGSEAPGDDSGPGGGG